MTRVTASLIRFRREGFQVLIPGQWSWLRSWNRVQYLVPEPFCVNGRSRSTWFRLNDSWVKGLRAAWCITFSALMRTWCICFQNSCPLREKNISVSLLKIKFCTFMWSRTGSQPAEAWETSTATVLCQAEKKMRVFQTLILCWLWRKVTGQDAPDPSLRLPKGSLCIRIRYEGNASMWRASVEPGSVETWSNVNSSRGQRKKTRSENLHHLRIFFFIGLMRSQ